MRSPLNPLFADMPDTIFATITALVRATGDVADLGQGFPDGNGPEVVREAAANALLNGHNQYPSMLGIRELRQAFATHEERFYGLDVDPETEVAVFSGATEALTASLLALLCPGDEAIIFEPAYDLYAPMIKLAGATPVPVRLHGPDWGLPEVRLADAITNRTKLIVLNTPMNPVGKVFSRVELEIIAGLARQHDLLLICDEVYEHMVFDGARHTPIATHDGMAERTVRIASAGKTFSMTGWKIGYASAPADLMKVIVKAHQFLVFTVPPALQLGVAHGLQMDDAFFAGLSAQMQQQRDVLAGGLKRLGIDVLPCQGTYFLLADRRSIPGGPEKDVDFCKWMITNLGVSAVPLSPFYGADPETRYIRFCFAKQPAILEKALMRLAAHLK